MAGKRGTVFRIHGVTYEVHSKHRQGGYYCKVLERATLDGRPYGLGVGTLVWHSREEIIKHRV